MGNSGHHSLPHRVGWGFFEKVSDEATVCVKWGEMAVISREALTGLAGWHCNPHQISPSLCCNIPVRNHGELNPIVLGMSCHCVLSIH